METIFQLLDCDYILLNGTPVIRLFGKTKDNKTVCAFYEKFLPYFYVQTKEKREQEAIDELSKKYPNDILKIQAEKKFLPIGFNSNPAEILRIVLKDPSKTPEIREFARNLRSIKEVFESDILFKYRFMNDFNLSGMKWIKVTGRHSSTNTVKVDEKITADKIENVEMVQNSPLKFLSLDIENVGEGIPDPKKNPIAIISLSFFPAQEGRNTSVLVSKPVKKFDPDVASFASEKEMLEKFIEIFEKFDPDIIIGYNINNFDLPFINERLRILKIRRTIGRDDQKPIISKKIVENKYRNSIVGRVVVDPYWMVREMVKRGFFVGLKRFGLGDVSKFLLQDTKVDVKHSEILKFWNGDEKQMKKLIEYARKDSELALKIIIEKGFLDKYIGISIVSGLLLQDSLDTGDSGKVENLLLREFNKNNFVIPSKPVGDEFKKREQEREKVGLKGAFVLNPRVGFHENSVVYLDFASMYAYIFIKYNICPTTLLLEKQQVESINTPHGTSFVSTNVREGVIPVIIKMLIKERDIVKDEMKKEKDEIKRRVLDAKQEALKRIGNSFYGYTGFIRARLYVLDIASAITSVGRFLIQKTKETIEKETPYEVVYGDTDSIMVKINTKDIQEAFEIGESISKLVNEKFENTLKLKIEKVFKSILILAKKRYAGLSLEKINGDWREEIVMKGIETVRRDWCDLVGETLQNTLNIILKEGEPKKALNYFRKVVTDLNQGKIPIEKLVITKGVSKKLEDYKGIQPHVELVKKMRKRDSSSAPGIGDRVGFVIVKGLQLLSNRAEDPDYVKEKGLKVDSRYYIEGQLLPPLERVFESMGIEKSELVGYGKQLALIQAMQNGRKQAKEQVVSDIQGFICDRCEHTYSRIPLIGKCFDCGGEILFYTDGNKSRFFSRAA